MDDQMLKSGQKAKIKTDAVNLFYGNFQALRNVTMDIAECAITAIIGLGHAAKIVDRSEAGRGGSKDAAGHGIIGKSIAATNREGSTESTEQVAGGIRKAGSGDAQRGHVLHLRPRSEKVLVSRSSFEAAVSKTIP